MKLLSVTIADMLAYDGEESVTLSRTTPERNIVLIWGRNGRGKTSFINALKLLFGGIENERMRLVGFPPRSLPPGQFVLGDGEHWMGIINRRALRRATAEGRQATASVSATWEAGGRRSTARREWSTGPAGSYVEQLVLLEGGVRTSGTAAAARLAEILPPDYVEFFFFDGEDIKALAETAERKRIDFDGLLRINFVGDLAAELERAASERRRRTLAPSERDALRRVEVDLDESRYAQRSASEAVRDLDEKLMNESARLRRAETVRENLSSGATDAQRKTMEERRKALERTISSALTTIVEKVPGRVPINANLPLVRRAVTEVERRLGEVGTAEQRLIGRIASHLAEWVAPEAVGLDQVKCDAIVAMLRARLDGLRGGAGRSGLFVSLDADRAERLAGVLAAHAAAAADLRSAHASMLASVQREMAELTEVDEALMRLRVGSEANVERYRENELTIKGPLERIAVLNQEKGGQLERLAGARDRERNLVLEQARLEQLTRRATQDEVEARYIDRVTNALLEAREALRRAARDEVEALLNERFRELVHDHSLISRIGIDDTYTLSFFDREDRQIGRASLSSGLKQLAATSLLWAMKDAAGLDMPVVIDTPLGRIDRENQDRMLANYYPRLSHQVVILPTNAEIDARKKGQIASRVAEEYTIENPTGDAASFRVGALLEG